MRCVAAISVAVALAVSAAGCGSGEGVSEGAAVAVYVDAALCAEARQALAAGDRHAGDLRVRAVCAAGVRRGRRLDLAAIGADARRASEDSTAVAFIEARDPAAARFAHPILESAGIGWLEASSGAGAMRRVLRTVAAADPAALRDDVRESLEGG